jgi:O-antigen ligase
MLMLPITAAIGIFNKKDIKRRYAALATSLLVTVCLAFTQSRSGWISELVALGVLGILAARYYPAAKLEGKQRLMAVLPFLAFAGIAALMLVISGSGSDLTHRAATLTAGSTDISVKQRLMLWQAAISMIAAKPVFGWGLGSYPYLAANHTSVAASGAYVAAHGINLNNIAHNFYLQTAAETGLVGLGLYVGMVATFFVVGVRALRNLKDGTRKMVLVGVLAAMAGQVVDAITSPSYNIASVSLFQWLLMAIGMFAAGVPKQTELAVRTVQPRIVSAYARVRSGMRGAAAFTALVVTATFMLGTANSAVADTYVTVSHDRGVSDADAWLIGVGAGVLGWYIGSQLQHEHDGRNR